MPTHEYKPESRIKNPLVARIAAEHEGMYLAQAREIVREKVAEAQMSREHFLQAIDKESDPRRKKALKADLRLRWVADPKKVRQEAEILSAILGAQAPLVGEFWQRITENAIAQNHPLPLTLEEQEEWRKLGREAGLGNLKELRTNNPRFKDLDERQHIYGATTRKMQRKVNYQELFENPVAANAAESFDQEHRVFGEELKTIEKEVRVKYAAGNSSAKV